MSAVFSQEIGTDAEGFTSCEIGDFAHRYERLGVYAVGDRLLLVRSRLWVGLLYQSPWIMAILLSAIGLLGGYPFSPVLNTVMPLVSLVLIAVAYYSWSRISRSPVPVQKLEKRKLYEVRRVEVASIDLMEKPRRSSEAVIELKTGEKRKIEFNSAGTLKEARRILLLFWPDIRFAET